MQLDPLGVPGDPGADQLGPVHRMPIHDQVHLPLRAIAQQPAQKSMNTWPLNDPTTAGTAAALGWRWR